MKVDGVNYNLNLQVFVSDEKSGKGTVIESGPTENREGQDEHL